MGCGPPVSYSWSQGVLKFLMTKALFPRSDVKVLHETAQPWFQKAMMH